MGHSPSGRVVSSSFVSFPQFQTATPISLVFVEFHPVLASRDMFATHSVVTGFTGRSTALIDGGDSPEFAGTGARLDVQVQQRTGAQSPVVPERKRT